MKATNIGEVSDGLPFRHIEAFLDSLRTARYSDVTLCKKRRVLSALSRWMTSKNIAVTHIGESAIASFMERLTNASAARVKFELAVLRRFLVYLRDEAITRLPIAVALRSFCHFLFLRGETQRDQYEAVPPIRKWRQSFVPRFLTPEQEKSILFTADRSTPCGRRDYAILLLLARLGLRAGEIVGLELGDIRWRSGELVIHGKGQMVEHVPLLSDVGEALADYLHEDRGASASRRVFLRMWAPHVGLAGPAAIGHIVRRAFVRAGFRPTCRGAAHMFRHGLATTMIRHGASMAEIAEVLRHRSQDSTAIYAKVAFEDLRGIARSWPTTGGV